jgi:hypothetical protein
MRREAKSQKCEAQRVPPREWAPHASPRPLPGGRSRARRRHRTALLALRAAWVPLAERLASEAPPGEGDLEPVEEPAAAAERAPSRPSVRSATSRPLHRGSTPRRHAPPSS